MEYTSPMDLIKPTNYTIDCNYTAATFGANKPSQIQLHDIKNTASKQEYTAIGKAY